MKTPGPSLSNRHGGFTLVELAVVGILISLLLGSLIAPLAAQSDMRAYRDTDKALADIREALIGFALVNGRLPCPAAAGLASGTASAGEEAMSGNKCACDGAVASLGGAACSGNTIVGVLPWSSLGLPETDAWGRRFTFAVDTTYAGKPGDTTVGCPTAPANSAFALCTTPSIDLRATAGGTKIASNGTPAIVISHGKNGFGAYTPQGTRIGTAGASTDETENANDDGRFVSNTNSDDRSIWVPTYILMHRMLAAGKLP